jgi:signal transduction histidine kinase
MKTIFNIKITYAILIASLIFWAFFAFFTMNQLIKTQEVYAKLINISGKQRMLSQKTALMVKRVHESKDKLLFKHLKEIISLMKRDHHFLLENLTSDEINKIYYGKKYNLNGDVEKYFSLLDNFLFDSGNTKLVESILSFSFDLLPKLDFAVNKYEKESEMYTYALKQRELFILIGTLLTIIFEAVLIVVPSVKRIIKTEKRLKELNQNLEKKVDEQKKLILEEHEKVKKREKTLSDQSKLISMGEMIGNIAHQWRQPLSVITTIVSGINLKLDYGQKVFEKELREASKQILQQADYLSKTIDDFRDFIKSEKNYSEIKITEVIKKTLSLVDASLKSNHIKIETKIDEDILILGNINELSQALINIIKNSKDALVLLDEKKSERGIFIETKKLNSKEFLLSILDTAGGIQEEIIDRIFEPYFTTKHPTVGTGIGLSMCDKIIRERHKGVIFVENREFEYNNKTYKGACFKIIFNY